jgi:hypothetical protein
MPQLILGQVDEKLAARRGQDVFKRLRSFV